jgi:sugar phosphate isomerase/epimerase
MTLGIASWTVPWAIGMPGYPAPPSALTPTGLLDKALSLGVGIVQVADNMPLDRLAEEELENLKEAAQARGIALEAGTRGIEPAHLQRYLDISQRIGARKLRTLSHTATAKPTIRQAAEWIGAVLPEFEKAGVAIALENNEAHSVKEYAWLIREFRSPALGICMDTANSLGRPETLAQVVSELAEHAIVVHIKDYDIHRIDTRMGFRVVGAPAGEGKVDFDLVFSALKRHGSSPSIILEHWPPFVDTIEQTIALEEEWVRRSMAFLRQRA